MSVFICWSGTQSHAVAQAIKTLLDAELPAHEGTRPAVFVSDSIPKGDTWFDAILNALNGAKAGIVCVTAENLASPWMHFEAGALARRLAAEATATPDQMAAAVAEQTVDRIEGRLASSATQTRPGGERIRSRLFTVLHGVAPSQLEGPLGAYQATTTDERDMRELVRRIAGVLELEAPEPNAATADHWAAYADDLRRATVPINAVIADLDLFFQRKTFNEPLHHCTDQAWLARYDGARRTRERLTPFVDRVRTVCSSHESGLFEMLLGELDGYAMAIQSQLLTPKPFHLRDTGELDMPAGIRTCCEDRRLAIRSLAGRLLHPIDDPLTPEAVRFMAAETHEERKMLVHRLEGRIRRKREEVWERVASVADAEQRRRAVADALDALLQTLDRSGVPDGDGDTPTDPMRVMTLRQSSWDLDRIHYYLLVQYFDRDALRWGQRQAADDDGAGAPVILEHDWSCAARDVEMEIERYRAKAKGGSLMPLTYALVALLALDPKSGARIPRVQAQFSAAVSLARSELKDRLVDDAGRAIDRLLTAIEAAMSPPEATPPA